MKKVICFLIIAVISACSIETNPIKSSIYKDKFLKEVSKNKKEYEIQVLLTKIDQNNGELKFRTFEYQLDDDQYFYPASTNKLPIVILALKKINDLRSKGSDITLKSKINLNYKHRDPLLDVKDSITSFQNLIADVFLISDNSASNILIDFIGYNYFNLEMKKAGFDKTYLKQL